jgi:hypothetical protein
MAASNQQTRITKQGLEYIRGLRNTVRQLWIKCCKEEGIPADSKFVIFSTNNKYLPFYNRALRQLWEAEAQYRAGGYVSLKISKGK